MGRGLLGGRRTGGLVDGVQDGTVRSAPAATVRAMRRVAFAPTDEGVGPDLSEWRIRWSDLDGYDWCYDFPGQDEPARYTGQPPTPYLH